MLTSYEILNAPFDCSLVGLSGRRADGQCFGEVGRVLMGKLFPLLVEKQIAHEGLVHWVYPSEDEVLVGVQPSAPLAEAPEGLELLTISHIRVVRHVHVGPYEDLPMLWDELITELEAGGFLLNGPHLEVYDHHSPDNPQESRTSILIGLED